ncbi:MAG: SRPBCC family protein, partial [Ilumatobacter sp.]|uniref:SRPBCC family protein n=1 Tax=Ilumatobacter sp. TaxID=1967498 RepID=UPI003C712A1A
EAVIDLRPGGAFRWVHDNGVAAAGEYVTVDPHDRVSFTYGWEAGPYADMGPGTSSVEVSFDVIDSGTRVTVEHSGVPAAFVDAHRGGWTHFLGLLAEVAAGADPVGDRPPSSPNQEP